MNLRLLSVLPLMFGLSSCLIESNQPKPYTKVDLLGLAKEGPARYLNKATYDSLPAEQQYQVANKLLGTLYKGITVREFFDMSAGMTNPRAKGVDVIGNTMAAVLEPMDQGAFNARSTELQLKYLNDYDRKSKTYTPYNVRYTAYASPITYLHGLPLSKDQFSRWVAYQLVNNILFSPAGELDSVDPIDVEKIYNYLADSISKDRPISDIVYEHMISQSNWRRFRTPEDNVREMMEIYLLRFRDDEVPRAAQACKNWFLTEDNQGYQLRITSDVNEVAIPNLLDTNSIVTCYDFYHRIATHPALIPTIAARAVDLFFPNYSTQQRADLVNNIVQTHPTRFDQIFSAVVFSEEYLLRSKRIKTYEENLLNYLARTKKESTPSRVKTNSDTPPENTTFFRDITNPDNSGTGSLRSMNQMALSYKLGRLFGVPTDTLSISYTQKALRNIFKELNGSDSNNNSQWYAELLNNPDAIALSDDDFLNYAFLAATGRLPNSDETSTLKNLFTDKSYGLNWLPMDKVTPTSTVNRRSDMANILRAVFDYASRSPETYTYN